MAALTFAAPVALRARLIIDNDFGGDPDGLFQLAHHLLSPTMDVRGVLASQHYPNGFYGLPGDAAFSAERARELLNVVGCADRVPLVEGASEPLIDERSPRVTDAAKLIVREAMRDDSPLPLYVACGAGLTSIASAFLMEPAIAGRLRLLWIGGPEHADLAAPPPGGSPVEYNLGIDPAAARVVFNHSSIDLWQIPRDAYRQALVSYAELDEALDRTGPLASLLMNQLDDLLRRAEGKLGEAYVLGDSPLVLLTALQSSWEVDPCSTRSVTRPTPHLTVAGHYAPNPTGRPLRVFTHLDCRLMFADFYAKVRAFDRTTSRQS